MIKPFAGDLPDLFDVTHISDCPNNAVERPWVEIELTPLREFSVLRLRVACYVVY